MKYVLMSIIFFSYAAFGCTPCDKEAVANMYHKALPKFPVSYRSDASEGSASVKIDLNSHGLVEAVEILELKPKDLPKDIILKMVKASKYEVKSFKKEYANCGVDGLELDFEFSIPQRMKIELDINFLNHEIQAK